MKWTMEDPLYDGESTLVTKATTQCETGIPPTIAVKTARAKDFMVFSNEKNLLMNKLNGCPFIIRCYGDEFTTEENIKLYNLFFEYASGGCLLDRIVPNKGMSEKLVRKYVRSVLVALSYIHQQGYAHCDVRPKNILLVQETDGRKVAKLADFRLAKRIKNTDEAMKSENLVGTCMYAAPESILSNEYGAKSDIWSLGITALLMLTGKRPPMLEKELYHLHFLKQISSEVSKKKFSREAMDFIGKCLVKDPQDRSSAAALLHHPFMLKKESSSIFHSILPNHCFYVSNKMVHASCSFSASNVIRFYWRRSMS